MMPSFLQAKPSLSMVAEVRTKPSSDSKEHPIMRFMPHLESPHAYPFIMLDRVESYDRKQRKLEGLKCVPRSEPLLQGHFPGFPIFPGVLLIECLSQASAVLLKLDTGWPPLTKTLL